MYKFLEYLSGQEEFKNIAKVMENYEKPVLLNGLSKSNLPFFVNYIKQFQKQKITFITSSDITAENVYKELCRYDIKAIILQSDEIKFYQIEALNRENEFLRINTLKKIYENDYDVLIITTSSLLRKYMPKEYYQKNKIELKISQVVDIYDITEKLVHIGYESVRKIESKGQFSHRGSILDIFPINSINPIRIEFFDDEIDSIRIFDLYTQISTKKVEKIEIIHAREYLYPNEIQDIYEKLTSLTDENTNDDLLNDLEKLKNKVFFKGLEKYVSYIYPQQEDLSIFQFIKDDIIYLSEPNRFLDKCDNIYYEFFENYKNSLEKGFAIKGQDNIFLTKEDILHRFLNYKMVISQELNDKISKIQIGEVLNFDIHSPLKYRGDVSKFIQDVKEYKEKDFKIVISLKEESAINNISKEFKSNFIDFKYIKDDRYEVDQNNIYITKNSITNGILLNKSKFLFITNDDIFFRISKLKTSKASRKNIKSEKITNFLDLRKGDIVVHETYGIGKFVGIEQKESQGVRKDFIKIAYKGGDYIYVPISQMDKVQRYIGSNQEKLSLTQLGSSQWKKQKQKAKKAAEEIAKYLVELYAKREKQRGFSFSKDTVWQREFESLFPFEETMDQLNAIKQIKKDMENEKPMDRLVCGDVGYGKTEVAIRAIFKACMDQKQVAFLVPTTILAQQHYSTLVDRFENYPINIEVLSRFKTKKQQEEIVEKLKNGEIDVVISTHRLLSKDVGFKDLGLLVIDEEQRFGVKHKEQIKQLKNNIDVLTLTATPIPRTLNMSLSGIRDMSVLEQPPNDRHPVITYVTQAREGIILDAIEREMSRGGQVFFVYNSIENISKIQALIKKLIPEAKIAIAHGQMTPTALEDIMIDYLEKKYDILLCTTIIETGMDISNANTIIVYNADKMGLSQLYQLRGRVGRSSQQAYAYFMYEKDKTLTEVAQKRLKAIKEFTEFGSGFKVAMMDLEIRGSGNILGESQHGHIQEVGYELYIRMLNESFKKLKGEIVNDEKPVTEVYIKVNAYIPQDYITDEIQKMEIYKKIASIKTKQDYYEVQAEIEDRFSNIPQAVENLLKISSIRAIGEKLGIIKISQKGKSIIYENENDKLIQRLKSTDENQILKEIIEFMKKLL